MDREEQGLVSIIMPSYNSAKYVKNTVQSVLNQKYENWELLITDDCSRDNTMDLLTDLSESDDRIKVFKLAENAGPAVARDKSIQEAKGRYITFLDSDDIWNVDFLKSMLSFIKENNYSFVFASYKRFSERDNHYISDFIVPNKVNYKSLLKTCPISCLTALYDVEKLGKQYMPIIDKRQDYGLWLKLLKITDYAYGYKVPLATYMIREGSVSRNKFVASKYQWKIYRKVERLNFIYSCYCFVCYFINGVKKYSR